MNDLSEGYKNDFSDVEMLLAHAPSPRTPDDLSARIMQCAVRTPQKISVGSAGGVWRLWMGALLSLLAVPRPALAFAVCLMIGLFGGWASSQHVEADDTAYQSTQALNMVVIEEEWL